MEPQIIVKKFANREELNATCLKEAFDDLRSICKNRSVDEVGYTIKWEHQFLNIRSFLGSCARTFQTITRRLEAVKNYLKKLRNYEIDTVGAKWIVNLTVRRLRLFLNKSQNLLAEAEACCTAIFREGLDEVTF